MSIKVAKIMFDMIIHNGKVIDGEGTQAMKKDVGISDGKIVGMQQNFVEEGEEWEAEGREPLTTSKVMHPPLHKGCDCEIAPA